uniref:Uncharacterized protein n=1 Tax=Moniliophthora roreri TaxID=221103 RepID=A0A0W0G7I6_MONRR
MAFVIIPNALVVAQSSRCCRSQLLSVIKEPQMFTMTSFKVHSNLCPLWSFPLSRTPFGRWFFTAGLSHRLM